MIATQIIRKIHYTAECTRSALNFEPWKKSNRAGAAKMEESLFVNNTCLSTCDPLAGEIYRHSPNPSLSICHLCLHIAIVDTVTIEILLHPVKKKMLIEWLHMIWLKCHWYHSKLRKAWISTFMDNYRDILKSCGALFWLSVICTYP